LLKKEIEIEQIIVIGGGASGMIAAGIAAERGLDVTLIERNPILGKKLLITGKGRCNLTNNCEVPDLIRNVPINGRFLTNAFYRFSAYDTIEFFHKLGLETKTERGNRVFPKSDKASDIVSCLENFLKKNKVKILHNKVKKINKISNKFEITITGNEILTCDTVIIATGGKSYPGTGSTGDGYKFAQKFGHRIVPFKPSLVPIEAKEFLKPCEWLRVPKEIKTFAMVESQNSFLKISTSTEVSQTQPSVKSLTQSVRSLQGLSLKNVTIRIIDKHNKKVHEDFGEMLFTHFGVSGPLILSASSHVRKIDNHILVLDLKPALTTDQLDKRIQRDFQTNSKKKIENVLKLLLPKKLIPVILELSDIDGNKQANQFTKEDRKKMIHCLKNLTIKLKKFRPIKEAIITSGGVDVNEINPKTMESKLVKGLFFTGEIIDVDAYTGGFNLQIAWSTGFAAGKSC